MGSVRSSLMHETCVTICSPAQSRVQRCFGPCQSRRLSFLHTKLGVLIESFVEDTARSPIHRWHDRRSFVIEWNRLHDHLRLGVIRRGDIIRVLTTERRPRVERHDTNIGSFEMTRDAVDSFYARDNEDLRHLLNSFVGRVLPGLYIHVHGSATRSKCSRTRLLGSERRVHLVPVVALWAQSRLAGSIARSCLLVQVTRGAKKRVEDAQKYWQYGRALIRCRLTDRLDPIKQPIGEKRSWPGGSDKNSSSASPFASDLGDVKTDSDFGFTTLACSNYG
jgi:hypothetical protein